VPGQLRFWDGGAWTAHTSAATLPQRAPESPRRRRTVLVVVGVVVLATVLAVVGARLLGISASVSTITTNDNTIAELNYSQNVRAGLAALDRAAAGLHPLCDKGGQLQGCYDADRSMLATINAVLGDLGRSSVPPRYAMPHQRLVAALTLDAQGFTLRNKAIEGHDDADWQNANAEIQHGVAAIAAALATYPENTVLPHG
jgi:hypothetical protein